MFATIVVLSVFILFVTNMVIIVLQEIVGRNITLRCMINNGCVENLVPFTRVYRSSHLKVSWIKPTANANFEIRYNPIVSTKEMIMLANDFKTIHPQL